MAVSPVDLKGAEPKLPKLAMQLIFGNLNLSVKQIVSQHRKGRQNKFRNGMCFCIEVSAVRVCNSLYRDVQDTKKRVRGSYVDALIASTPYSQYPYFLGYHVDPVLKKEVFTLKNPVFQQTYPKESGYFGGYGGGETGKPRKSPEPPA